MGILSTFNKLKSAIVGTKTADIDVSLDKAIKDITSFKSQSGRLGYIELLKSLISKQGNDVVNTSSFVQSNSGAQTPAMYGQARRLGRYKTYESIVSHISYCFRALTVFTENILSPDDITKKTLDIKPNSYIENQTNTESKTKLVKEVIKKVQLEKNLDLIVKNTLLFGDFFVEIGTVRTALTGNAYLAESYVEGDNTNYVKSFMFENDEQKLKVSLDYSSFVEAENREKENVEDNNIDPDDIKLMFHEPKNIVKLQTDLFPVCFGYLVFPRVMFNRQCQLADQAVNDMCLRILKDLENKIPQTKELQKNEDLIKIIKSMINGSDFGIGKQINIRYVPADKIEHFKVPSIKYYPYGESIFDSVVFQSKVLVSLETALTIQRLARSTEKRKIAIEVGLPRDAKKMVESIKEKFRKRKISLDSFGTVDTIPSMITTFEDIYIPQKDGKPFVDIDTFTGGNVDIRSKVDELKFMRDSLIAALGVPPAFLSLEENVSTKATLSDENILFARAVIGHQKYLTEQTVELIQKLFQLINPEESLTILDNITITFPTPKSLQFELLSKRINDTVTLIESLERIGVPQEYSKKKYLEDIDWDEVENFQIGTDIEKKLGTEPKEAEDEFGMGGGMGGVPSVI